MDLGDIFTTIADIAIALIGFSAIVVVFSILPFGTHLAVSFIAFAVLVYGIHGQRDA